MTLEEFNKVREDMFSKCSKVLDEKAEHYHTSGSDDRLIQFKKIAILRSTDQIGAISGAASKHATKLFDMLEGKTPMDPTLEDWDETLVDMMNYCIIMKAAVIEEQGKPQSTS